MIRPALVVLAALVFAAPLTAQSRTKDKQSSAPEAASAAPGPADWRTPDRQDVLVIDTNKGRILVEMVPEVAPNHVARVRTLARQGFYDHLTFFRVIEDFMDQTGDPKNTGEGASTQPNLTSEFAFRLGAGGMAPVADQTVDEIGFIKSLPVMSQSSMLGAMTADGKVSAWGLFCTGVAGMARGSDENSANSQFFLMRATYPKLEKRYTAWGRVISGQEVVLAIKVGEPVADPQDRMERVRVLADIPDNDRPHVRVIDPKSAWFKAEIERVRQAKGANFSACDLEIPVEVK
jgi:peptidylprolyl isomerase